MRPVLEHALDLAALSHVGRRPVAVLTLLWGLCLAGLLSAPIAAAVAEPANGGARPGVALPGSGPHTEMALLSDSTPKQDSTLTANPHWIRLFFRTEVTVLSLELHDAQGHRMALKWGGAEDPQGVVAALLPDYLPSGTYEISYKVADARGNSEDVQPREWVAPGAPQAGKLRFTLAVPAGDN